MTNATDQMYRNEKFALLDEYAIEVGRVRWRLRKIEECVTRAVAAVRAEDMGSRQGEVEGDLVEALRLIKEARAR